MKDLQRNQRQRLQDETMARQSNFTGEPDHARRDFLKSAAGAGALSAATAVGLGSLIVAPARVQAEELVPYPAGLRRSEAYRIRLDAALSHLHEEYPRQISNGDEEFYPDRRANFFKCLPQDDLGEVDPLAYEQFLAALRSGEPAVFEAIPLSNEAARKLANPQAAYAFELMSRDSRATVIPPAPAFASAESAAEIAEVYWQAATRDVPFSHYGENSSISAAVEDLNYFTAIKAPLGPYQITTDTVFRAGLPGDLLGPYLSQFLWLAVPYGAASIEQRYPVPIAGEDFMTDYSEWLAIQRGAAPTRQLAFDPTPRYLYNGRALSEYVHKDALFQAYFNAAMIINSFGSDALDRNNPYLYSTNQSGFATFGAAHLFDMVAKAARLGLEAAWFHKWLVHRRLRPEVFAARIHNQLNGEKDYGINQEILDSDAVEVMLDLYGTRLLPQAYPEGSPTHPAYPAGHSAVGGACATVLKAFVNEDFVIPEPVQSSENGDFLDAWDGDDLTLGNEINKLAGNISIGRCTAGVHFRSDGRGLAVGEAVAIGMLRDYSLTYNENFAGFTLTTLDGRSIRIVDGLVEDLS